MTRRFTQAQIDLIEETESRKLVKLSDIKENIESGLSSNIAQLIDEGYTIQLSPMPIEPSPENDENWKPVKITVLLGEDVIKSAIGMIFDEVIADVYMSTPERSK